MFGSLPFALALTSWGGRSETIATFRELADLKTFHAAWLEEVSDDTARAARFQHYDGRVVRVVTPSNADNLIKAPAQ